MENNTGSFENIEHKVLPEALVQPFTSYFMASEKIRARGKKNLPILSPLAENLQTSLQQLSREVGKHFLSKNTKFGETENGKSMWFLGDEGRLVEVPTLQQEPRLFSSPKTPVSYDFTQAVDITDPNVWVKMEDDIYVRNIVQSIPNENAKAVGDISRSVKASLKTKR